MVSPVIHCGVVWLLVLGGAIARATAAPEPGVEQLFAQRYQQAATARSSKPLESILDDHFTAVLLGLNTVGQEQIGSTAALADHFAALQELIGNGTYVLTVRPDGPADYAGDMASAHGSTERGMVTGKGGDFHLINTWTAVFRRRDGAWKLLRLQESMDPVSNPLIMRSKHDLLVRASFMALVVGMALGWLFRGLFARKPALGIKQESGHEPD